MIYSIKNADRIRRDSVIDEQQVSKVHVEPIIAKEEPQLQIKEEPDIKFEIAKPGIVTEEADEQIQNTILQNNVEDEFGIRAEALYDYQAGNRRNV